MPSPSSAPTEAIRGALAPAPFLADVADAAPGARAWWATTPSGVRIRLARLGPEPGGTETHGTGARGTGARGTVLLLPGRTEFIEKYGPTAQALAARGYATASLDWRGQGLSDRLLPDRSVGHVGDFAEYQEDLRALCAALPAMGLRGPLVMLAHSMGGAIGLRALADRADSRPASGTPEIHAAVFTGPMWGIRIPALLRPLAPSIIRISRPLGLSPRLAPGTTAESYLATAAFADNQLTTDPEMFAWMQRQVVTYPDLGLGGPSIAWVGAALAEITALRRRPSPALPCLTLLGGRERIIDTDAVRDRMAHWPGGTLAVIDGAEHEILMETPARRQDGVTRACDLFDSAVADRP